VAYLVESAGDGKAIFAGINPSSLTQPSSVKTRVLFTNLFLFRSGKDPDTITASVKQRFLSLWQALSSRRRKQTIWGASLVLFYTVFGFFILPLIVKAVAISQLSKQLDREVTIRQVKINPYVLSGTIRGLLVKDKDGEPFLSFEEAYANFQLSSFFGKPWVFKDVWTVKPYCRAQINKDYTFNFSDLTTKFSQPSPQPKKPSKPLYLHVGRFQILSASASFADLTLASPFHRLIGPVQIMLTDFHTDPNNQNPYSFSGTTDGGERFAWSGQFSLDPLQSAGQLSLEGLSIPKYAPLFQEAVRFEIKEGVVEGRATYRFSLTGSNYIASVTNLSGALKHLKVAARDGSENLVELDQISVSGISADTAVRTAEIGQIAVDGGRVIAKRNQDESINLLELAEPSEKTTAAPGGGILFLMKAATNAFAMLVNSTNFWSATIHTIDVTNCEVHWDDAAVLRPVSLSVDQIAVTARHLSNIAGSNQTATVSLRWNTNGTAQVGATVQISPPVADVTMNVTNLELKPLDPYLESFVNLFLTDSKLGVAATLHMQMGTNDMPEATLRGDARLDDFAAVDAQTEDLLKWKSVQVRGIDAGLQPPGVAVKEIAIVEPFARVAFDTNQNLNLLAILKTASTNSESSATNGSVVATADPPVSPTGFSKPAPDAADPSSHQSLSQKVGAILKQALAPTTNTAGSSVLPKVTAETISITNGLIQFNDQSVQPPVLTSIEEVNGTISGVSSEELNRADIHIQGKAARTGPIEIRGKINPLNQSAPTELAVIFSDVDLTPTSPYSGKFLGYRLNRGRLGLQVDYSVSQRQLKAKNLVTLDQFTLGEKVQSPDATKLPVKLALALLKDRNGKIEIDLPIEGNLDDPEFRFGKVILHVLVNLITKMVTSPFAALGSLFGGKGEEVSYQDFEAGSAELQAAHAQKLNALIDGLYERPGLELQIEGSFDPSADAYALRKQKLIGKFRQQKWAVLRKSEQDRIPPDQVSFSTEEYIAYLDVAYRGAVAAGVSTNSMTTNFPPGKATAAAVQPVALQSASGDQKGATALMQKANALPETAPVEKEQIVLSTIKLDDEDLMRLATARSQNVRQRILDSGKVDAARLTLMDITNGSDATNRASRVYFHLE